MEIICIDRQTFEELRVRFSEFEERLTRACRPVEDLGLKNWLDNQDVCEVLRISKKTLQVYRAKGILPFSRIKNKLFYKPEDIRRLLELNYHPLIRSKP
ncbi:helix-turn-helix domain-containing protein [Phocaeicola coprocola]|uniref:helix-turn-helix domain-containing protein n=1 Tax=Phocaeicola coprocola TaxID=310298 RepID=UPI0026DD2A8A|nr:helix-turn-helix domain-containing protein [Phocaeicola coprocola]